MIKPPAQDALRQSARQMMEDLSNGRMPTAVWVGDDGKVTPASEGTSLLADIVADASEDGHKVQLEYGGEIYTTYEANDVASGAPQPMLTIDDAEYWFGEMFTDEKGWLGIATDLETGEKTYFASVATSWDLDGRADSWTGLTTKDRKEADRFRARLAIENSLNE